MFPWICSLREANATARCRTTELNWMGRSASRLLGPLSVKKNLTDSQVFSLLLFQAGFIVAPSDLVEPQICRSTIMNANAIITRSAQAVAAALIVTAEVLVF